MRPTADGRLDGWLNAATALLLVVAAGLLARDRLLPAWRAGQVVEVGESAPEDLALVSLASGDTLRLGALRPSLLMFFQSTCPACTRNLPAWRRLTEERPPGVRTVAVGLEPAAPALAYVREEMPRALGTRPLDSGRATRVLGVEAVPTTLLLAADGRVIWRRSGVLDDAAVRRALETARLGNPAGPLAGSIDLRTQNGRRP